MYELTDEQNAIITTMEIEPIVLVAARAGTGKTSTSLSVVDHFKPKHGFYTAFNKSIVLEGEEKFPTSIECRTKHAFALRQISPKNKIGDFTYTCFEEKLSYADRRIIMDIMESFFLSDSVEMEEYISQIEDPELEALAIKYIEKMINDEIRPSFNFLLKYLHLLLDQGLIKIEYDLAILDECQDTTAVFYEIFKLIKADRKLIVGDPFQNIYGFMNTVNAFNLADPDIPKLGLTKTFRCSVAIAKRVEAYGQSHLSRDFKYIGTDSPFENKTIAYIGRTNGEILMRLEQLIAEEKSFSLTRPVKEIFSLPMALVNRMSGGEDKYIPRKYKYLIEEYKKFTRSGMKSFYVYLMQYVDDDELHSCINFMSTLREKNINIFTLKKAAEKMVANPNIWVVTAHSFKGREVDTVVIEKSLNKSVNKIIQKGGPENRMDQEELNLGYVAITRAKHTLKGCQFA